MGSSSDLIEAVMGTRYFVFDWCRAPHCVVPCTTLISKVCPARHTRDVATGRTAGLAADGAAQVSGTER